MSVGDFEALDNFENEDIRWLFYIFFSLFTLLSMVIILNMVIAVMASTFERVESVSHSHIMREKLMIIQQEWYRIPKSYKKPKFLESLRAVLTEEGAVNLECKVIGVPQPTLSWFKDGVELKQGWKKFQ